jgi:3-deoxy-D-manno-octulosonic-acid transferase
MAIPFIRLYLNRRVATGLEDGSRITERFGIPSSVRPFGKLIWIHAVSVGEFLSVIPFIEEFRSLNRGLNIVLTTTTLTAAKLVQERFPETIIHQFVPFDVFAWIQRFLKFWKPDAVFFVESELWPNTLFHLAEMAMPTYLLNARISDKTLKRLYFVKAFLRILPFKPFQEIFVTSREMKRHVLELGAKNVVINPNMKIISTALPFSKHVVAELKHKFIRRSTWIAVSTHKGEEEIIIEAHKKIQNSCGNVLTVIAVRHPDRAEEVLELCQKLGLSAILHTAAKEQEDQIQEDIYIVDQIGCLGDFFELITTVLVCGSLIPGIGGHNILEPMHFLCNVATGQYIENCEDIYQLVEEFCQKVTDSDDLANFVVKSIQTYRRSLLMKNTMFVRDWRRSIKQLTRAIYG